MPRSTLPGKTPNAAELDLADALPKPADLGPSWDRAGVDRRSATPVMLAGFKSAELLGWLTCVMEAAAEHGQ